MKLHVHGIAGFHIVGLVVFANVDDTGHVAFERIAIPLALAVGPPAYAPPAQRAGVWKSPEFPRRNLQTERESS
jgi:hypothetical protein